MDVLKSEIFHFDIFTTQLEADVTANSMEADEQLQDQNLKTSHLNHGKKEEKLPFLPTYITVHRYQEQRASKGHCGLVVLLSYRLD